MMATGGIVLAAGASTRFGAPKQLAPLRGRPLLEHACRALAGVPGIEPRVVVLGSHAGEIREAVDLHGARAVVCEDWADGQSASLAAGLDAVGEVDCAVVVLGDQPGITPEVVALVLETHADGRPARATFGGAPGHPVVIPAALFDDVRALRGDRGARDVLARAGVREVEAAHLCSGVDIDTPADLEAVT